jgi:DNA-directed RNA polymerase subunit RPC12/RpoP
MASDVVSTLLMMVVMLGGGGVYWYYVQNWKTYYCRNCGQIVADGHKNLPSNCPKCRSNRFTGSDPGVGEKVRTD